MAPVYEGKTGSGNVLSVFCFFFLSLSLSLSLHSLSATVSIVVQFELRLIRGQMRFAPLSSFPRDQFSVYLLYVFFPLSSPEQT